ncbi:MAG: mevalonate kinase [Candidatus Thermoplasmatota archaeon]|nr:mevalonate kinase [Candidatus Thermoplasmatota archaeon]
MSHAAAPGKIILFGEHAVVFGEPAVAVAIDLETKVDVIPDERLSTHQVNDRPMETYAHLFIEKAVELLWDNAGNTTPLSIRTNSRLPSAAGLGSSAALSTATCASLLHLTGQFSETRLARAAYETEWLGQGKQGSPIDTSASTHGQAIYVAREKEEEHHLWSLRRGDATWHVHHQPLPRMPFVVAHSGEKGKTAEAVAKVAMYVERTGFAEKIIEDLGEVTRKGRHALVDGDLAKVGSLMTEAHGLLGMLGVSTSRLDELCDVALEAGAYGAKLTGGGAGGCMVALCEDPNAVRDALVGDRADAWVVRSARKGARAWGKSQADLKVRR